MTEVNAPESCVMLFEGQGGAVGFGKGAASVTLRTVDGGTELSYEAKAQVGGKLAQVGSRLIDSVAKKMTDDFFKAFESQLNPAPSAPSSAVVSSISGPNSSPSSNSPTTAGTLATQGQVVPSASKSASASVTTNATSGVDEAHRHAYIVPAWWLAPAAILGALLAIAGAQFMH
jgi:hypothetical protein